MAVSAQALPVWNDGKPSDIISPKFEPPTPPKSPSLSMSTPRTISELISFRARQAYDQPILGYPVEGMDYAVYTYGQLEDFTNAAAQQLALNLPLRSSSATNERVVALLGSSNLEYLITALALSRLGFTVLFLSTRISEAAYISLLDATKSSNICIHSSYAKLVARIQAQRPELNAVEIVSKDRFTSQEHSAEASTQHLDLLEESKKIAWIIHSSGSTGLPKPIFQTHAAALRNYENSMNMEGFITLPLFHAHGLSSVLRGLTAFKRIFMYPADLPLTKQNLLKAMTTYSFEIFYGVPYALKLLSEDDNGIDLLSKVKVVMFGGSACPDGLGDLLVRRGVNLISHYGTTETGQLMTSQRPIGDLAWNYVRVHEALEPFVQFETRGENLFELVVLEGWPSKVATNRDDGSYATKDLFEPHPVISGAWKYAGRLDDTIVLVNGEKAVPIPMEMAIRQNPLVQEVVIFGSGKTRLGMIVIASREAADLPHGVLIERLWPIIEAQNQTSPAYAHISKDAIRILPAGSAYPQTDKGTLIRQAFYKAFSREIEQLYQELESGGEGTLVLNKIDMRRWLKDQVALIVPDLDPAELNDNTDLFSLGIDSLQSSRLRAAIQRDIALNGNSLPQNIVFEQPSVTKLADAIAAIRTGIQTTKVNVEDEMMALIEKYGMFPAHVPTKAKSSDRIVVLPGATGSLGAHIAARLASRDDVSEVCCLVRAPSPTAAFQRVLKSMHDRAVLHSLPLRARCKITAFPADLSRLDFGLDAIVYQRLKSNTVSVIHSAWSVNFNKSLSSFEDCIASTHNLLQLCLAVEAPKPASFNFCSSVSTTARTPGGMVPEALPESLNCAQGMGYAQSKLVTEHIVARAAAQRGMAARVLRIGQIVADRAHGIWNETEAIPLMLQAAVTIGALPTLNERPRWLPVDVVASCVEDISLSVAEGMGAFFNLVNPGTFHWTDDLLPALSRAGLTFAKVAQREWIQRLRNSNPDVTVNPTYKLLEFFSSKYDREASNSTGLDYEVSHVEALSPAIRTCEALTQGFVDKFVQHFLSTSWKKAATSTLPRKNDPSKEREVTLIVLAGPCGSGKSSVATQLAHALSCPTIEGDALHDAISVTKMSSGVPLSAMDRAIWLSRLRIAVLERLRAGALVPGANDIRYIIVTCSALRYEYREALRDILRGGNLVTQFVMLEATEDELIRRVEVRQGHYMKSCMVKSQLEAFEQPTTEERDVLPLNTETLSREVITQAICGILGY